MSILSAAEVARLRATAVRAMTESCRIDAGTSGGGAAADAWATTATVACYVVSDQGGAGSGGLIDVLPADRGYAIGMPVGTAVAASDRIVCNGVTYEAVTVEDAATYGSETTVRARRVTP